MVVLSMVEILLAMWSQSRYMTFILQFLTCEVEILNIEPTSSWLFWGWHELIYRKLVDWNLASCRHYTSVFYYILLLCCHRFFVIWLHDTLPNVSPFLLSFWTVCYSSYINCDFLLFPFVLFISKSNFFSKSSSCTTFLTLSDLSARSTSSAYRSFHLCCEELYSIDYFLCCILLFLYICIYFSS